MLECILHICSWHCVYVFASYTLLRLNSWHIIFQLSSEKLIFEPQLIRLVFIVLWISERFLLTDIHDLSLLLFIKNSKNKLSVQFYSKKSLSN